MKRIAAYGIVVAILGLASCKEIGPKIDFNIKPEDTTYETTVELKKPRIVMIEEFTGVSCPPCPNGHERLDAIELAHPGSVAIVGIQIYNWIQGNPVVEGGVTLTKHDNRTQDGTDLGKYLGPVTQTPSAAIDRVPVNSKMLSDFSFWSDAVNNRLTKPTPANLYVTSSFNSATRVATIDIKVAYTEAVSGTQLLNVYLREDSLIDAQEVGLDVEEDYLHKHTLRDILTGNEGSTILDGVAITPGRVYERRFFYTVNAEWKPEHCVILANVSKSVSNGATTDKEILQAAEVKLK